MMKLLDSNIVIYGTKPQFADLRQLFGTGVCVSVITLRYWAIMP